MATQINQFFTSGVLKYGENGEVVVAESKGQFQNLGNISKGKQSQQAQIQPAQYMVANKDQDKQEDQRASTKAQVIVDDF